MYTLTQPQDDNHDLFPGSSSPPRAHGLDGPGCAGILVPSGVNLIGWSRTETNYYPDAPWCWYIYLHVVHLWGKCW